MFKNKTPIMLQQKLSNYFQKILKKNTIKKMFYSEKYNVELNMMKFKGKTRRCMTGV